MTGLLRRGRPVAFRVVVRERDGIITFELEPL